MKRLLAILGLVSVLLTAPASTVFAASETGHSDLMRLLAAIYGLNLNVANHVATINQSVDKVPLSAATDVMDGGTTSEKLHFGKVITRSDLNESDLAYIMKNGGQRSAFKAFMAFVKNDAMGGGVASLSNAEAAEMMGHAMEKGDGTAYLMGLHYLLDVAGGFHDGYLGALSAPLPVLDKFIKIPLGHLVDGTSPDRVVIGKVALAMQALGPFLITLRETQKDAVGVNTAWMEKMKSEGVDMKNNASIMKWFFSQSTVKQKFEEGLPAEKSELFVQSILEDLRENLTDLNFFNDLTYLDIKLDEIETRARSLRANPSNTTWTINALIKDMLDQAWKDGKLNEKIVIDNTVTDYLRKDGSTQKLEDLILKNETTELPEYVQNSLTNVLETRHSNFPHTRPWILDQILEKVTRGMLRMAWQKFDTAYLNPGPENARIKAEAAAIGGVEAEFFGRTGKYSYNPGSEYWTKIFQTWGDLKPQLKKATMLQKVLAFSQLIVSTKIYEGYEVHSPSGAQKFEIFLKTIRYLVYEEFLNPMTANGNFGVKEPSIREQIIAELRQENPQGLLTPEVIEKSRAYNEWVNAKYNSDQAVGFVQKAAQLLLNKFGAKALAIPGITSGAALMCKQVLIQ